MKIPARLGWLVAVLLALSLLAPLTTPASAMQTSDPPSSTSATAPESDPPSSDGGDAGNQQAPGDETGDPAEAIDEPVVAAALGDLKLYSKSGTDDVPGVTYTIYDETCASVLAGPSTADSSGIITFDGVAEQGASVCVAASGVPAGYLVPDPAVITLSTTELLTQWSIVFTPAAAQTYDLPVFKVDNETDQLLGGAGFTLYYGACPGGEVAASEQFTGAADATDGSAGRTVFFGLDPGDYCVVETTPPSGYSGGGSATVNLPANVTGWTFGNDLLAADTYDLPIFKTDSVTDRLLGGAGFTLFAGACPVMGDPVRSEQFTGASDAIDGSAGRTIFAGLTEGTYCVVETSPPPGYTGGGSATVSLPANASGWTFQNAPLPVETYDLPIFKEDSVTGAKLGGAGFTLYAGACPATGPGSIQQFTGSADATDGSAGRTIFTDLTAGTYCVVETAVPTGYMGGGSQTLSLPENASGWTFENDPIADTGTLSLLKRFCYTTDPDDAGTFFTQPAGAVDCILGAASFYAWPSGHPEEFYGPFTTSSESGIATLDLPAGNYMLMEIGSGAQHPFTIAGDQVTTIPVWNVLYDEGSLYVTKIYCKSKFDTTDISFDYPDEVTAAGWNWGHKPKCWQGDANFEVWLYGNPNDVIVFRTGSDGEVWLTLPETTAATGAHKLVETDTGTWAWFDITRGQITYATVTNYFKWQHPRPVPPTPSQPVTTLPSTGTGAPADDAWFMFGMSLAGLAGLAGFALRGKPGNR